MTAGDHHGARASPSFLSGGGESAALVRSIDWSRTPLGPVEGWSQSLKTIVGVVLHSRHPMFIWWGPSLVQFYNDAYLPSFGKGKHPAAMGQSGPDCWQEIWPVVGPQIDDVMQRGIASWHEDQYLPIFRNGRLEDVYWTYSYSPIYDDDGSIGGTLVTCTETTGRVLVERRLAMLRKLADRTSHGTTSADVIDGAAQVLGGAIDDVPFALFYSLDRGSGRARLTGAVGLTDRAIEELRPYYRELVSPEWLASLPLRAPFPALELSDQYDGTYTETMIVKLSRAGSADVNGFIVFGINPKVSFDHRYRDYFLEIGEQLSRAHARIDAFRIRAATEGERNNLLLQAPVPTALLIGPEHVFEIANPLYREMVGKDRPLVGRRYLEAFPELINTPLPGILDGVYQTGKPFVTSELLVPLNRGNGQEEAWFRFNLEAMRDLDGKIYGMMATAVEITEQVEARRVLEKAQAERDKLLAELEAASRAKDEFLAMLGHELRNPLSPIVTALELMKLRAGDDELGAERRVIERQVTHLVRLVDDLLDISKVTRGKIELRQETVEVAEVLAKAVEIASFLLEKRNHHLSIEAAPGLRWHGDPVRLAQVIANLLTNAARYTEIGGRIQLRAGQSDGEVVVSVKDNGIGIAPDVLPRVFDLFFQGKRNLDRAEGGLGIGLALVKNLVAMHGGHVEAKSEGVGRGSEFVIHMPAGPVSLPRVEAVPVPVLAPAGSVKRVLVVDDNEDAAELLGEMLRTSGHEVSVANDPLTALGMIDRVDPEVAILDIGLPVMDGYQLAARMRARNPHFQCRLIALTGYGQDHDRARSEAAGFEVHLVKPVDIDRLLSIVAT